LTFILYPNLIKSQSLSELNRRKICYLIDNREELQDSVKHLLERQEIVGLQIRELNTQIYLFEEEVESLNSRIVVKDSYNNVLQKNIVTLTEGKLKLQKSVKICKIVIPISFGLGVASSLYLIYGIK
tara:strand:- start:8807 stop:9187 length:381 start_codon:yes stop_codon:yes gene_type:complete